MGVAGDDPLGQGIGEAGATCVARPVRLDGSDRALILNSEGDLILARLNPKGYAELARANVIGPTWAHPAFAGGCVLARSDSELVCVSLLDEPAK